MNNDMDHLKRALIREAMGIIVGRYFCGFQGPGQGVIQKEENGIFRSIWRGRENAREASAGCQLLKERKVNEIASIWLT